MVKYRDDQGNVRMSCARDAKWRRYQEVDSENVSEQEEGLDVSAHLHEYARRAGPNEDSDSVDEKYNISVEEEFEGFEGADVYTENDSGSSEEKPQRKLVHHQYARDYLETDSSSEPEENEPEDDSEEQKPCQKPKRLPKPCKKAAEKIVYVYKQPPIVVKPKSTNVYIKSKPILVQPPPLVVHHPQPKPCNPIIKYQPPNIQLKPVIVKISKPKTTTTTPCPPTIKKPCRKCIKKPAKQCGRCSRRKQATMKSSRPKDVTVYYNQHHYRASEPAQYVQYKNPKCVEGGCLT